MEPTASELANTIRIMKNIIPMVENASAFSMDEKRMVVECYTFLTNNIAELERRRLEAVHAPKSE